MNTPPHPSTYRQTAAFHRKLFDELLQEGYSHPDIFRMSLREALLARYGTPDLVDAHLGEGTYRGVQATRGALVPWRMAWSRVRRKQKAAHAARQAALEALEGAIEACNHAIETCQDTKVSDPEIRIAVAQLRSLTPRNQAA